MCVLLAGLVLPQPALGMGGGGGGGMGGDGMGGGGMGGGDGHSAGMEGGHDGSGSGNAPNMADHELARAQHMRGNVPTLSRMLNAVRQRHPGKVLDVRLDRKKGKTTYVFTIMTKSNRIITVRMPLPVQSGQAPRSRIYNFNTGRTAR